MNISTITNKAINNEILSNEEIQFLTQCSLEELSEAAIAVTGELHDNRFDLCSIINAKSGKCSENCKWCAQSAHFKTKVDNYGLVSTAECVRQAKHNESQGIHRFSLVTSGRKLPKKELEAVTLTYKTLQQHTNISLCASLGLMEQDELQELYHAGVRRYHCNLETAPDFFDELCTTHSQQEKVATIQAAQAVGMEVCSGGIIGMGESLWDRCMLALTLRKLNIDSIPINILVPIEGTPLENQQPLSQEDILQAIALFRIINPKAKLRFSGGRTKLSLPTQKRALAMGVNAAIVGDLLTTIGRSVKEDLELFTEAGFHFDKI